MKYGKTVLTIVGVLTMLAVFTSQANAEIIDGFPGLGLKINEHAVANGGGPPDWINPPGQQIAATRFQYGHHYQSGGLDVVAEFIVDPDPYVNAVFTITNLTGADKDFTFSTILPIFPQILNGSLCGGSVSFNLLDMNANGATLKSINATTPIYMSTIDGVPFKALMEGPQSHSTPSNNGTLGYGPEEFGPTPGTPLLPGPNVLNTIGIELNATLSAGDVAVIIATFAVVETPEPATMALLALGGMTILARRRRHKA